MNWMIIVLISTSLRQICKRRSRGNTLRRDVSTISLQPQRGVIDKGNKPTYKHVELISFSHVKRVIDITETEGKERKQIVVWPCNWFLSGMFFIFYKKCRLSECFRLDMPKPLRNKRAPLFVRNHFRGCWEGGIFADSLSPNGEYHLQSRCGKYFLIQMTMMQSGNQYFEPLLNDRKTIWRAWKLGS